MIDGVRDHWGRYIVVVRQSICEVFINTMWDMGGQGMCIRTTGEEGRDRCAVVMVMWDSGDKGFGGKVVVRCRVRMMARDVAHRIRGWLPQNGVLITCGSGKSSWGRIGTLV